MAKVKVVQIACRPMALYGLDENGVIWEFANFEGKISWVKIESPNQD